MSNNGKGLPEVLANHEADLLADWIKEQAAGAPDGPAQSERRNCAIKARNSSASSRQP